MEESLRKQWGLRTPSELDSAASESPDWIVDGWIPRRRIILVAGDSGLGKSPFMYQIGLAVSGGLPVLGRDTIQGKVLYLDGENGINEMAATTSSLSRHIGLTDSSNFLTFSLGDAGPRWSLPEALKSLIITVNPILVVVDTVSTFWPGIEEKNALASGKYTELRSLIGKVGCSFVLVHHLKKNNEDFPRVGLEDSPNPRAWFGAVRGASALVNNADIRLGVDLPSTSAVRSKSVELVVGGFGRVRGTIPLSFLERVRDDEGDPLGYSVVKDLDLFEVEVKTLWEDLPFDFTFKDAKLLSNGRSNNWLVGALGKLRAVGLVDQPVKRGGWKKLQP